MAARPRCRVKSWNRRRRPGQTRRADLGDARNEARMHAPATVAQVAEPKVEPGLESSQRSARSGGAGEGKTAAHDVSGAPLRHRIVGCPHADEGPPIG